MKAAIEKINENASDDRHPVVIRLLFGNIPAMPVRTDNYRIELFIKTPYILY